MGVAYNVGVVLWFIEALREVDSYNGTLFEIVNNVTSMVQDVSVDGTLAACTGLGQIGTIGKVGCPYSEFQSCFHPLYVI